MDQGLSGRRTVHLRLQVQLQMNSAGDTFCAYGKADIFLGGDPGRRLSAEEPESPADFILADDGGRVAVADAVLVGEPVGASSWRRNAGPDSRWMNHSASARPVWVGMRAMRLL